MLFNAILHQSRSVKKEPPMSTVGPTTETMKMTDAKQQFSRVVSTVHRTRRRVLVEKGGVPVAAIVSTEDLERLNQLDADWDQGFEILDEIGTAFDQREPEEIERETARALIEVRSEMRSEREGANRRS